jgi:hypothetical protein
MDVWLLSCMGFVSLALLEYAVLLKIMFGQDEKNMAKDAFKREINKKCKRLDKLAMVVFIAANALFNGYYWSYFSTN